jgi:methylmalonyl-CoA mutase C-terminal domain/subunit
MKTQVNKKIRVLVAKVGLDGHDRGVKIVARALRDAGIEVIYLGIHNTPQDIVSSALQEDVDAIGLSIHSAAHMTLFGEVIKLLKKNQARAMVFGGGIVPQEDMKKLERMGVQKIFTPGAPLEEIVKFVSSIEVKSRRAQANWQRPLSLSGAPARVTRSGRADGKTKTHKAKRAHEF